MTRTSAQRRSGADLLAMLDQRLTAAASVLLDDPPALPDGAPVGSVSALLLPALVRLCRETRRADARWLLLTGAFGAFPSTDRVLDFGRYLELAPQEVAESALLADVLLTGRHEGLGLPMALVDGGVVVDVDFSARHDTHTGIHRVVRETVPRWAAGHDLQAVAWTEDHAAFRTLSYRERAHVFSFTDPSAAPARRSRAARTTGDTETGARLVVPWRSTVVLIDVPNAHTSQQLAALARFSGNTLTLVGYDMIPITSAEMRPPVDAVTFAGYLTVLKHAHRVAGISRSAAAEFAGFAHSITAQGLPGPDVREVLLAGEGPRGTTERRDQARPVVLLTGSKEPHKNQRAALHAAERLWREGLDFEVRLVGGPGWSDEILRPALARLEKARRPVVQLGRVSDGVLSQELRRAHVVVFASLHEGYGLPVAEALAAGTPVITSNFGSQAEIAQAGGCLTVDPRDDDALTAALRVALTDEAAMARLRADAAARPVRTWDEYAEELWTFMVDGRTA